MKQVSENVFVEAGRQGGNHTFVVTGEGIVLIDTPYRPTDAVAWRDEVNRRGEVRYLIQTEPHIDHVTGNGFLPGTLVAHELTREAMRHLTFEQIKEQVTVLDPGGLHHLEGYHLRLPTITFKDSLTLYLGDHVFHLMNLPGHTAGQTAVYIPKEKVVITGDNVTYKIEPYMREAYPEEWLRSLQRLQELDVTVVVPGHGRACGKDYLVEEESFIREWLETVQTAIDCGWTVEQAQERISFLSRYPMNPGHEAWGAIIERGNVARLYELLSAKPYKDGR